MLQSVLTGLLLNILRLPARTIANLIVDQVVDVNLTLIGTIKGEHGFHGSKSSALLGFFVFALF